jgi:serine O-acetyltransferase
MEGDIMSDKKATIINTVERFTENYRQEPLLVQKKDCSLPSRDAIIGIVKDMRHIIFPGYFGVDDSAGMFPEHYVGYLLSNLYDRMKKQIEIAYVYQGEEKKSAVEHAKEVTSHFFTELPDIQTMLMKDVQAGFDGDPAAKSKEEIIFSYPGLLAIYVYRLAHVLYTEQVPFIPRIMTEYAHGRTGIDINPGATIGEYFFIDHGTGVVIGETTEIGNYVKLYQGVTLGALSTRKGQQLANIKRHPTIRDNVTIYSNSSVLGGETVIGENTIIGGNTFITESIPANTRVSAKSPELVIKQPRSQVSATNMWDWEG